MGYIRHHSIAVSSYSKELIESAHKKASEIFKGLETEIKQSDFNKYFAFFVIPDGSKEGWDESDLGDKKREVFINWINQQAYEDGSNSLRYCEFFFSDEEGESEVINHN